MNEVVGHACVDEHVIVGAKDGACEAHGVAAKYNIPQGNDHHEELVVDVIGVVNKCDVDVDL